MVAYAARISKENVGAIASEGGRKTNLDRIEKWIEEYGEEGYFIRDETSIFDCELMMDLVFFEQYFFEHPDTNTMFRHIIKR